MITNAITAVTTAFTDFLTTNLPAILTLVIGVSVVVALVRLAKRAPAKIVRGN